MAFRLQGRPVEFVSGFHIYTDKPVPLENGSYELKKDDSVKVYPPAETFSLSAQLDSGIPLEDVSTILKTDVNSLSFLNEEVNNENK